MQLNHRQVSELLRWIASEGNEAMVQMLIEHFPPVRDEAIRLKEGLGFGTFGPPSISSQGFTLFGPNH